MGLCWLYYEAVLDVAAVALVAAETQTILVGDSGVGKTSLLVQFDQGKFIPGSFSATVGIGFTVSASRHQLKASSQAWCSALGW
ncbi:hypothetical protein J0S82_014830 [Galemys pyrenaicus]|uniref:Ras-related protein Rab-26 n=1 Tax=Galemys pyrenaicus TaxID=202257 RepID=A0A8J5ZX67_GALPY|nr:hypothetical protein J0S82_014830 [Galemys pyrenaicus]